MSRAVYQETPEPSLTHLSPSSPSHKVKHTPRESFIECMPFATAHVLQEDACLIES